VSTSNRSQTAPLVLGLTVFTSAFLLFLVQPLIAKQILPWFGGSAAVWTTCLVFFQVALLAGYAYAHTTTRRFGLRTQVAIHGILLAVSLLMLPIVVGAKWKPQAGQDPAWQIVWLLDATIGLPYFLLSTTGPLVQVWFARAFATFSVYRLFALSNFASLLALLAYPFLIEPWVRLEAQAWAWSAAYVAFAALCIASGILTLRSADTQRAAPGSPAAVQPAMSTANAGEESPSPSTWDHLIWLSLSAIGSWLLLAVTNHITQNVASIPFLWIVPLSLYLMTFILAFDREGLYRRAWILGPLAAVVCAAAYGLHGTSVTLNIKVAIPLYLGALFAACMFLHGELAGLRPAPRHLTSFYLMIALGGALGALGVGFVAPHVFVGYHELGLGLVVLAVFAAFLLRGNVLASTAAILVVGVTGYYFYRQIAEVRVDARVLMRNFYGTLKTRDTGSEFQPGSVRRLVHGVILHGEQYLAYERRLEITTYYGHTSGVGLTFSHLLPNRPRRIGVVGLGTGTLAAFGRAGDTFRFYELNPQVLDLAQREFGYLSEGEGRSEVVLGDARLSLERESARNYDLIVIDAFSSDAIPTHLLTKEAMAVYLRHLHPDGIIAFHVTNRFLDLAPVVRAISDVHGLTSVLVSDEVAEDDSLASTDWALVSRDPARFKGDAVAGLVTPITPSLSTSLHSTRSPSPR
jgi:hypothetical protein